MVKTGRIIEERKNYYLADIGDEIIPVLLKGNIKKKFKRILAGDFVDIEIFKNESGLEGVARKVHRRKNELYKPALANIDRVIFIVTLKEPSIELDFIDRFLFYMESLNIEVNIVFNKKDLIDKKIDNALLEFIKLYKDIGYNTIEVSGLNGENISDITNLCKNGVSIFAGPSGAGKSTILSHIFPNVEFVTNELSKNISRGVHTTTFTTLLNLGSAYIADTPGFSFLDLPKMDEEEVKNFFVEFSNFSHLCRFNNCMHINEPGCAIKSAIEDGTIFKSRFENYKMIFKEVRKNRLAIRDRGKKQIIR